MDTEEPECGTCLTDLRLTAGHVMQCPSGHMQCSECFVRLGGSRGACPACFQRLGAIRNLYVEKVRDTHKAKQAAAIPTLSLQEQVLQLALAGAQREKSLSEMRAAARIDEKKRARAAADAEVEQRRVGNVQRKEAEANEKQRKDDDRRRQEREERQAAAVAVEEQRARTAADSEAEKHRVANVEWKEAEAQDYARRRQMRKQKREEMRQRKEKEANKKQTQEDARWRHQQVERRQAQLVALWETGSGLVAGLLVSIVAVPQTTIAVLVGLMKVTAGIAFVALKLLATAVWAGLSTLTFAFRPPRRRQRRWYEGVM